MEEIEKINKDLKLIENSVEAYGQVMLQLIVLKRLSLLEMVLNIGKKLVAKRVAYLSMKNLTAILKVYQTISLFTNSLPLNYIEISSVLRMLDLKKASKDL